MEFSFKLKHLTPKTHLISQYNQQMSKTSKMFQILQKEIRVFGRAAQSKGFSLHTHAMKVLTQV